MEYDDELGAYEPGFLHLRVLTEEPIKDLNELLRNDPKTFSTFLHEYIHFLQNITTTTGLQESILWIDYIKHVNWVVRHNTNEEFLTPFALDNTSNVKVNIELTSIYRGAKTNVAKVIYQDYSVETVTVKDMNGTMVRVNKYIVNYTDYAGATPRSFHFGYRCIKEYVAHAVQCQFEKDKQHDDIPYVICEMIMEKECPQLRGNTEAMIALCDACLMSYHPAQIFFETLARMKKQGVFPSTAKQMHHYVYDRVTFKYGSRVETVNSLFEAQGLIADGLFREALMSDPLQPTHSWTQYIITAGHTLRMQHPDFISNLVTPDGKLSETFWLVAQFLGTPFFTDKRFNGNFIYPHGLDQSTVNPYIGIALIAIINVFHGANRCYMHQFCKSKPEGDITNEHCLSAPWMRVKESNLCPLATLWKAWGLEGKFPTKVKRA